jgi:hypothetical protein
MNRDDRDAHEDREAKHGGFFAGFAGGAICRVKG